MWKKKFPYSGSKSHGENGLGTIPRDLSWVLFQKHSPSPGNWDLVTSAQQDFRTAMDQWLLCAHPSFLLLFRT